MIGIYCIENTINGKKYIGQSVDIESRLAHHKSELKHNRHQNDHLQKSYNKYGDDCFCFYEIIQCKEDELDFYERKYIAQFNSTDSRYGYNSEDGGHINKHMSEESKRKMSESKKGMYDGENNPMHGVHLTCSEEKKKKLSVMMSGENNPMYGVHLTISEARRKKHSDRMKGANNPYYGKKHSEETRDKMRRNKNKKKILCVDTGVIYESAYEASISTSTFQDSIYKCCCKKQKTANNLHWQYVM